MQNIKIINIQPQYTRFSYDYQDLNKDPKIHYQIVSFFQFQVIFF